MRIPKIYHWHIKYNWCVPGLAKRLKKAQKDLEKVPPCDCLCDVGMVENSKYYCIMCKKSITI